MANVPTDEAETPDPAPVTVNAIALALKDAVPDDQNIVTDVKVHDGCADINIRWRNVRWARQMAIQDQSPEQMADVATTEFREWLIKAMANMAQIPRHARVLQEIKDWLNKNPDKREWLYAA